MFFSRPLYPVTLSYDEITEYERAFKDYDINGDGVINVTELNMLFEKVGVILFIAIYKS